MAYTARPVPQNIMNVEFKVFDFLTVKQLFIGVGILIVAVLLFFVLPSGWNIAVSGFIIFLGFIVLFVPFNGDPFLVFVSNYLEAMITDQRRVWHKKGIILKTAAQKALYYRYGAEIPLSKIDSYFMMDSRNNIQHNIQPSNNTNIDQLEDEFLSKSDQLQQEVESRVAYKNSSQGGTNLSKELNFIHTSSTPSESFGIVNLSDLNNQNSQNFINSETYIKRESEVDVKNFIFGYVEDEKENPISGAIVNLKKNDSNVIEVLISNTAGEFKTAYEYPEGEYILEASKDGKNINEIKIYHNPIDPEPIILSYGLQNTENNNSTLPNKQDIANNFVNSANSDVFEGEYDPSFFSVDNIINESLDNKLPNTKTYQNNNVQATSLTQNTQQNTNNSTQDSVKNDDYNNSLNQNEIINFVDLPNAKIDVNFNTELIYLFNTINGCIVNKNNLPIKGINVRILGSNGNLVNSTISDNLGRFYSISPLPNGYYFIDFVFGDNSNAKVLLKCFVILNGLVIHPKLIVLNI